MKVIAWVVVLAVIIMFFVQYNCTYKDPELLKISLEEVLRLLVIVLLGTSVSVAIADGNDAAKKRREIGVRTVEKAVEAVEEAFNKCPTSPCKLTEDKKTEAAFALTTAQSAISRIDVFIQSSAGRVKCDTSYKAIQCHFDDINKAVMDHIWISDYEFDSKQVGIIRDAKSAFDTAALELQLHVSGLKTPTTTSRFGRWIMEKVL